MKIGLLAMALATALAAGAADVGSTWENLDEKSHVSGAEVSEDDMPGKVVMVVKWDKFAEHDMKIMARYGEVWSSFRTKKMVFIGSYEGGLGDAELKAELKKHKLAFPVYRKVTLQPKDPKYAEKPYAYLLDHRGRVICSNNRVPEMTESLVNALGRIGVPPSLCGDMVLKHYKGQAKNLVLGKSVANLLKTLERDRKSKAPGVAEEASDLAYEISKAQKSVEEEIEIVAKQDANEAIKLIALYQKTWPKDGAQYKERLPELKKLAAEQKKAAAEKAKAKKAAAAAAKKGAR